MLDAIDIDDTGHLVDPNQQTQSITIDKATIDLSEGDSDNLFATTTPAAVGVKWTSSDSSVATVDSTGKVTAIGAGTATTTDGSNLSASCTVNVTTNNDGNNGGTTTGASAIVNIAYAKGDNTNNAGGDVSIIFNGVPDTTLSVVKTASVKSVWVGDTFTYTIVVTNTGSKTAKAVVINDNAPNHIQFLPSGITTTQGTVDSSSSASKIVVNVGDIPHAGTVTITVPVMFFENRKIRCLQNML
ncbi:bacterial Ig-like domain protein [Clostridium sp. BL-8]|nr:bacterial Ig-like domain protein [Clostridium sp. BL-8]